jgi:acetate kinase
MPDLLLVLNAGSSSIKFQLFAAQGQGALTRLHKGQLEGIGVKPRLRVAGEGAVALDRPLPVQDAADLASAFATVDRWLSAALEGRPPAAIGHRVVHGGVEYSAPVLVTDEVLAKLEALVPLAPLHQPNNLTPIRAARRRYPQVPQVACFDTAFHRGHPDIADRFAIPDELHRAGIRRYGFHGLSYAYVADRLRELAPEIADGRVVILHLGSGASLCALRAGRSVDSTMGFSALDGVPMGTRPGQLDPGVLLHLVREGWSAERLERLLYRESGLKALSGVSSDMRELERSQDPRARFAIDYFTQRVAKEIGALAAVLGGLDAIVFTAGIGENSAAIRDRICRRSDWLGVHIDASANAGAELIISRTDSPVRVYVVPTDEESMIARQTLALLHSMR